MTRQALVLVLGFSSTGCILPFPHRSHDAPAVRGIVVAKETGEPIEGVEILDLERAEETSTCDSAGVFVLGHVHRWHAAHFYGGLHHSIWPHTQCSFQPWRRIRIVAPGYEPVQLWVFAEYLDDHSDPEFIEVPVPAGQDGSLEIEPTYLKRSEGE